MAYSLNVLETTGFKVCTVAAPSITSAVASGLESNEVQYSSRKGKKTHLLMFLIFPYAEIDDG